MSEVKTKFFTYLQNNSGGVFCHTPEDGIGYQVCIEAVDYNHANARAEGIGLYFYGCDDGRDCDCCGDRWYKAYDGDEEEELPTNGGWGIPSYIHYLDGRIVAIPYVK